MTYTAWLRSLGPDGLAELLQLRPDAADRPPPAHLDELAARLTTGHSTAAALAQVDAVALQLAEVLAALGGLPATRLRAWFGESPPLTVALTELKRRGLVWESGPQHDRTVEPTGGLRACWRYPLNLGGGLRGLLGQMPPDHLDLLTRTLGVKRESSRRKTHDAIVQRVMAAPIVALAAEAPPPVTKLLDAATWDGPNVYLDPAMAGELAWATRREGRAGVAWAVGHGLLLPLAWDVLQMPREVGVALRGTDWRPTLRIDRPTVSTMAVDVGTVEVESAAASAAALDVVTSVIDTLAAAPLVPLRSGGVGVREIRRLTKAAGADGRTVVLAIEVSRAARLIAVTTGSVLPTPQYDAWRSLPPGERLVTLLEAWWSLDGPVSERSSPDGDKPRPPLTSPLPRSDVKRLRQGLLGGAAGLAPGTGVKTFASLLAEVSWQRPMAYPVVDKDAQGEACWWEAGALGLVAHGAVTVLGRAVLQRDAEAIAAAARVVVPAVSGQATFQADLTAIVPGPPDAALADLLDAAASREARGSAHVWRFTTASVRRFLDGGGRADQLLADLATVASQPLPQPLEYLVHDVARRHGEVAVRPVACCVVSADEPLLAEIAAHRSLHGLGLRLLAPTVLASGKPVADTVDALRSAGYAPVRLTAAGQAVLERDPPRRAVGPGAAAGGAVVDIASRQPTRPEPSRTNPVQLARDLLDRADTAEPEASASLTFRRLLESRTRLGRHELRVLSHAIDHKEAVHIDYVDQNGSHTSRVISDIALFGSVVEAWCHLRQADRMFSLSGIESVSPAD